MTLATWIKLKIRPLMRSIIRFFLFYYYDTSLTIGGNGRVSLGKKVATSNTLFNVSSGSIYVGDYTIFGQNVMLLTGRHQFVNGQRAGIELVRNSASWGGGDIEVPSSGYDIVIGNGTWIASGVIITGGVSIGSNSIVAAGAVVTKNMPDYAIIAGVPAVVIGDTRNMPAKDSSEVSH